LNVNWAQTGYGAKADIMPRVFFNVQGREPQGLIPAADYQSFQDEMKARLERLTDNKGQPLIHWFSNLKKFTAMFATWRLT